MIIGRDVHVLMTTRCCLGSLLVAMSLAGSHQQQSDQPAVFRSAVESVTVAVLVTDHNDQPISDLSKTDFEIREDGNLQQVLEFKFVSVPLADRSLEDTFASRDVVTNSRPSPEARQFVIVVDDLHLVESDLSSIKRVLKKFLSDVSPDDETAIAFTGRSDLGVDFTSDMHRLAATVDRVREALGFGIDAGLERWKGANRFDSAYRRSTVFTLRNVVNALAGSNHARRAVLYVSNGFSDVVALDSELRETFDRARQVDVPIYTIDPRGLVLPEDAVRGGIGAIGTVKARNAIQGTIASQQDTLLSIAANTGGRAFVNRSDLMAAVDAIVADNGQFYVLGYYPEPLVRDGRFHNIDVKVKRSGVRVRARSGYLAPPREPSERKTKYSALENALAGGQVISDLPMRASAKPIAWTGKAMTTIVTVEFLRRPSLMEPLRVRLLALDSDGEIQATGAETMTGTVGQLLIDLRPQTTVLRVGVATPNGTLATTHLPVSILDPSKAKVVLSGLLLTTVSAFAADLESAPRAIAPFQPTTERTFRSTDTVRVFARAFWRTKDRVLSATLRISGAGKTIAEPVTFASATSDRGLRQASVNLLRSLATLVPGEYVLELSVQSSDGERASQRVPISIVW
jgi:VWFA-related protein